MRAKEQLFSAKKQEVLRDMEHYQMDKAYEVAYLWSQVCSKQPHLANTALTKHFALQRYPAPPQSDWTSYSKFQQPADIMDGAEVRQGNGNKRNSLASSVYNGLKNLLQGHTKTEEYL